MRQSTMGLAEKNSRSSSRTLTQAELRSAFDSIERDLAAGRCVPADRLLPLRCHALDLAAKTGNPRIARRLAKLLAIAGHEECDVTTFLRKASTINPSDAQTAFMLSDALVAQDK